MGDVEKADVGEWGNEGGAIWDMGGRRQRGKSGRRFPFFALQANARISWMGGNDLDTRTGTVWNTFSALLSCFSLDDMEYFSLLHIISPVLFCVLMRYEPAKDINNFHQISIGVPCPRIFESLSPLGWKKMEGRVAWCLWGLRELRQSRSLPLERPARLAAWHMSPLNMSHPRHQPVT